MRVNIKLTKAGLLALDSLRIYSSPGGDGKRFVEGDFISFDTDAIIEPYVAFFRGSNLSPFGSFSYSHSPLFLDQQVGRYCSIAVNVRNFSVKHPLEYVSTSHINTMDSPIYSQAVFDKDEDGLRRLNLARYDTGKYSAAVIENDVWIGEGVLLARNITVGTGGVIAANSVVTKDVPPYAIVGGVPAKLIRYRFEEALIERLVSTRWWRYHVSDLHRLDYTNPRQFVEEFDELVRKGELSPFETGSRTFSELFVETLQRYGDPAPSNLIEAMSRSRIKEELARSFPVPEDCTNWYPAERDPRDGTVFRFFARKAWMQHKFDGTNNAVSITIHYSVDRRSVDGLELLLDGSPLSCERVSVDSFGRESCVFRLPKTMASSKLVALEIITKFATRPAMLNSSSKDHRILSLGVSLPVFITI